MAGAPGIDEFFQNRQAVGISKTSTGHFMAWLDENNALCRLLDPGMDSAGSDLSAGNSRVGSCCDRVRLAILLRCILARLSRRAAPKTLARPRVYCLELDASWSQRQLRELQKVYVIAAYRILYGGTTNNCHSSCVTYAISGHSRRRQRIPARTLVAFCGLVRVINRQESLSPWLYAVYHG